MSPSCFRNLGEVNAMNTSNLASRLKKEFLRNKAKSTILGVIFVVAIYFWAPLISGWLPWQDTATPQTLVTALPQQTGQQPTAAVPTKSPGLDWLQLSTTIAADAMMDKIRIKPKRNPFAAAPIQSLVTTAGPVAPKPEPAPVEDISEGAPMAAGELKLTSIFVGPAFSEAVIDGQTYTVNDELEIEIDMPAAEQPLASGNPELKKLLKANMVRTAVPARIVEINVDHILLVMNRRMRKLPLYQAATPGITIKHNAP